MEPWPHLTPALSQRLVHAVFQAQRRTSLPEWSRSMCWISSFSSTITVRVANNFFFFCIWTAKFLWQSTFFAMLALAGIHAVCIEWPFNKLLLSHLPQSELETSGQSSTTLGRQDVFIRIFIAISVHEKGWLPAWWLVSVTYAFSVCSGWARMSYSVVIMSSWIFKAHLYSWQTNT